FIAKRKSLINHIIRILPSFTDPYNTYLIRYNSNLAPFDAPMLFILVKRNLSSFGLSVGPGFFSTPPKVTNRKLRSGSLRIWNMSRIIIIVLINFVCPMTSLVLISIFRITGTSDETWTSISISNIMLCVKKANVRHQYKVYVICGITEDTQIGSKSVIM
ncbi:unnamed protein product, partial [Owenia fusiformis]